MDGKCRHVGGGGVANKVDLPQSVGCSVADGDGLVLFGDGDGGVVEGSNAASVAELANAEERAGAKLGEEVGAAGREWKGGEWKESGVGGLDGATIREGEVDGTVCGANGVAVGVSHEEVAVGASIC